MANEKKVFKKLAVPEPLKQEIAAVAGHEGRYEYELVEEAWKLYKLVAIGKSTKSKNIESVPVVDVISSH